MAEHSGLELGAKLPYCRGCGHAAVIRHLSSALARLQLPPRSLVLVTDIGCVGLADSLFPYLHTVHTTHGRSTAIAAGLAMADLTLEASPLKPIVMIGDGGAMIGLLHLVHAAQLNVDVTVLVHNNFLFGMTGGQHSALTLLGLVTATTPQGNPTPPLDLLALLRAARAGFLARHYATDANLDLIIAEAIAYPGFAVVEILELCPTFATRWNQLTGEALKELIAQQGYATGRLEGDRQRPSFRELYQVQLASRDSRRAESGDPRTVTSATLAGDKRMIVAGSAGERVQSAAALFCRAALACGLYTTQKNDNPVTQGTGFSLAEICVSAQPIDYTGMDSPDVLMAVSEDGLKELHANGTLARASPHTLLLVDEELETPAVPGPLLSLPFRRQAGAKNAALSALAAWASMDSILSADAWEAATEGFLPHRRDEIGRAIQRGRQIAEQPRRLPQDGSRQ